MNKEKGLKWYFGPNGGQTIGPNDAVRQNFKGNPYYYIVREAIQNSIDAVLDSKKPVIISFELIKLNSLIFFLLKKQLTIA